MECLAVLSLSEDSFHKERMQEFAQIQKMELERELALRGWSRCNSKLKSSLDSDDHQKTVELRETYKWQLIFATCVRSTIAGK